MHKSSPCSHFESYSRVHVVYFQVAKEVKPKRDKVAKLERTYHQAKRDLDKINKEVQNLEDELKKLSQCYILLLITVPRSSKCELKHYIITSQ